MDIEFNDFATKISEIGGRAYFVGGCVRDSLFGKTPKDIDICITGLTETQFTGIYPGAKKVGRDFPVYICELRGEKVEVAFARTERKISEGYTGFEITTDPSLSIGDDLLRRDFTINSMAKDILTGELIDPFGGLGDIERRVLRATSPAFREDPLRVYRAARFAGKFGFGIDEGTLEMMKELKIELSTLSVERVTEEMTKALKTENPEIFFECLRKAGVLGVHFPEIYNLMGVPQDPRHHPEGDAYAHTMLVLKAASKITESVEIRFGALVHDLGKASTPKEILPRHIGHEKAGVPLVENMGARLRLSKRLIEAGKAAAEHHMKIHRLGEMRPIKIVDLIEVIKRTPLGIDGMAAIALSDARGKNDPKAAHPHAENLVQWGKAMSLVKGNSELPKERVAEDKRLRQAAELKKYLNNYSSVEI